MAVAEGSTATFSLTLSEQPVTDVTVNLRSSDADAAAVAPATLTFTSTNWNVAQTLTVTGVEDLDIGDEAVTLTMSSTSASNDAVVAVTVADDDQLTVVISPPALSVNEGGAATATVTLSNPPLSDTAVTVSSSLASAATAMPAVLVFTTTNYATPQTLSINGVNDANTTDESATITLSATGATPATLAVTVNDDDQLGLALPTTTLTMAESDSRTLLVNLTAQPSAIVTVNVISSDPGALTALPATLTFTPSNWNVPQNIGVDGVQDPDAMDEVVMVTVSAAGLAPRTATVTVTDDDVQRILPSTIAVTTAEGGTAAFAVHLQAQPVTPMTVTIASGDPAIATAAPATLTFNAANYALDQTVTVTGVQDADTADDFVQLSLTSATATTASVGVTVNDDDTQAVRITVATLNIMEGSSSTFGVHLAFAPSAPLTVTISPASPAVATVVRSTLTFLPGDYAIDQLVTVSGTEDLDLVSNSTVVTCTAPGATGATLSVTKFDNDTQGFVVTPGSLALTEGQSATVMVRLAFQPPASLTLGVASSSTEMTLIPGSLSFTTANWSTPQAVALTSIADTDGVNDSVTLMLSAPGVTPLAVPVTINDTTIVSQWGWPTPFSSTEVAPGDEIRAYRITVPAGQTLDRLGLIAGVAGGDCALALYTEVGAVPGTLVASTARTTVGAAGRLELDVADAPLAAGTYYLAIRAEPLVSLVGSSSGTATRCTQAYPNLAAAWPATFGSATCTAGPQVNLFAITFQQP